MTEMDKRLKLLERALMDSAIGEGYSFEDDPFCEQVPPYVAEHPAEVEKWRRLPEGARWPAWAKWAQVPCPHCQLPAVLIRVGDAEDHWFSWQEWTTFYGLTLEAAGAGQ